MRAFIGCPFPRELNERVLNLIAPLVREVPGASWARSNLHVTLAFIGELAPEKVAPLTAALEENLASSPVIRTSIAEVGFFPGERRPRVAWIGLSPPEDLTRVATSARLALNEVGCNFDAKPFVPHVTFARMKTSWGDAHVARLRDALRPLERTVVTFREVVVFESQLSPRGAVHTRAATIALAPDVSRPG